MRLNSSRHWLQAIAIFALFACLTTAEASWAEPAGGGETAGAPTVAQARAFVAQAEKRLEALSIKATRTSWVQSNFITYDTQKIAAEAQQAYTAAVAELAAAAKRFDGWQLPTDVARKLKLLKLAVAAPAPPDPHEQAELTQIEVWMKSRDCKGRYCPQGKDDNCLDLGEMEDILATSRAPDQLRDIWGGWRTVSPPMRGRYQRFVALANKGAHALGFTDLGAMWRSNYDMPPEKFTAEVDRLWQQVKPLYDALHAHVRASLAKHYGTGVVSPDGLIPAHLVGNMWAQSWGNIYPLVAPPAADPGFDLSELLKAKKVEAREMVRYGERFFTSLDFEPLPESFWQRSLFTKPADRDVVCHASAWDVESPQDLRIKMCIKITAEDFSTIHHELGHNFYQRAYGGQSFLYRGSANDGFHEAVGDAVALSVTPDYLAKVGLLERVPEADGDLGLLMKMALEKVAFLPFGLLVDQWRWKVFSGEISPADYNQAWWELREKYQGIKAPVARSEEDFDPGAKYHIPANVPYTRYFLAHILQFQFHRALCRAAGYRGPLHRCSIYNNKAAGAKLKQMLEMGMSRSWPEALEALTGEKELDATAILDYFAPLKQWLDEQNKGRKVGF
ncbi:MAG: M2 family metallopeptidase [Terriglobia bacterium]